MNTITQIENALKGINQASFQILVNHLLHLQGNKFIGAPGAVVGKEKTSKGTPDSFFVNEDRYVFVECTTQERLGESKSFFEKLAKDIDHCYKEEVTTIKKEQIEKVILACNEKISVEEYDRLNTKVKSYNSDTKFEILTIQNLPLLIFDIPKLADEYLNIPIIKGDIYTLEEFLLKTEKGLQPSLTNEFIGREEELKNSIEILKNHDILLLSGGAGIGKSKLGVKILEEFYKDDYVPIVIQSSGVSLWDDYQHLFLPGKQHVILFDDANKSITNLNYLLSKLEGSQSYHVKVVITSRDYVKKQVSSALDNYLYKELNIPEFKDDEIAKIIVSALPNLQHHSDIKRKIVDLAKGNARVALMATYSVTPDSETNYLDSPVLLYEKYFKKISEEVGIFNNPIILKSLAIVSFFGVVDKNNEELKTILFIKFGIDWNELWTAIMELHNSEILDVYADEIVRVSDQVLSTYAFYKCFVDDKSAVINYAEWIAVFVEKFSSRIRSTLVDANNTFAYHHVKGLVLPHLNEVLNQIGTDGLLYAFYDLFWFYKGRNCLLYLKKWIGSLQQEQYPQVFNFGYVHNDHTSATKHFELLKNFWNHPNELLKPSLELMLTLLDKQPSRLPEILKFLHENFNFKVQDVESQYLRQNVLLDVLIDSNLNDHKKLLANGIFLNLAEALLGWHYTEFGSAKGHAFTIYNFDLYKSDKLMGLRKRILNRFYDLFMPEDEQSRKILQRIINPDGDIDKSIYIDELPLYQTIIAEKLDSTQYADCKFVSVLGKHLTKAGTPYPQDWDDFIESDIRKLYKFLKPDWEYKDGKSIDESEKEKREELNDFVKRNDWKEIEKFLLDVDTLFKQQNDNHSWHIESAVTDIYASIARKDKGEFDKALRLYFSREVSFQLRSNVLNIVLQEDIMTGEEFIEIMNGYELREKFFWESALVTMLPADQINKSFLILLIEIFNKTDERLYIHRMLDYLKYEAVFEDYKKEKPELEKHNIITYLTSIVLIKTHKTRRDFGFHFCSECVQYFENQNQMLRDAFWAQYEIDSHFDYDGKELKTLLDINKTFINESLKSDIIGLDYSSKIKLRDINTDFIWEYEEYEELIEDILLIILDKVEHTYFVEEDIYSLFKFRKADESRTSKVKTLIIKLTQKYCNNDKIVLMLAEVVYNYYRDWFVEYFKEFLVLNNDIEITKRISFDRSASTTGSWVPVYQKKIEFYEDILKMINSLPNILDYSDHIDYFEQKIIWKKKDIEREQKRDFMDEFY
ncbi:nSTAND3 domain-containing NTPase [Flavobacterium subsaxonicum]|uniref:Novel STAND NTPase 3 domain-containing protein n=1 Tax=Flavobacterium subsaxonicum WB 4.1-42 = DSM 21790 TaxID=1121898 RepID=A0A0A2MNS7_9FLAO|nr:hypothetical protein [Flavobacterium subsaxonicum]KGO93186.1 hypothetical protein Q766_07710 [Flavobacterium subsaxonicum WB 4.1-42 = DSM 21790]